MQQLGLVATRLDRFTTRPEFGRLHDDIMFWTCEDFSINTLDRRAGTEGRERGAKLRRLVSKAYEDSVSGASIISTFVVAVGRKPS